MRKVIRLGNSTNCGVNVVSATNRCPTDEKPATQHLNQDAAPIKSPNKPTISEEDDLDWSVTGLSTALNGSKGSCGAILLSAAQFTR